MIVEEVRRFLDRLLVLSFRRSAASNRAAGLRGDGASYGEGATRATCLRLKAHPTPNQEGSSPSGGGHSPVARRPTFGLPPRPSPAISVAAASGNSAVLAEHSRMAAGANMLRATAEAARPGVASSARSQKSGGEIKMKVAPCEDCPH